jgi:hypothetical protein
MVEAENVSARANTDIERILEECSERTQVPEVLLLTSESVDGAILAINMEFLEQGQLLACPGLPLVGAAFDPDWGFARVEIKLIPDSKADFHLAGGHFDTFRDGDTSGYRLCPIDAQEIPQLIRQLAHIRAELAKPRTTPSKNGINIAVTEL